MNFKFSICALILLFATSAWAQTNCHVTVKKISVADNGVKQEDEVREHRFSANDKLDCFQFAQDSLSFYPRNRSYYGPIARSDFSQSYLYSGRIDVYYFSEYEFISKGSKNNNKLQSKGRIQADDHGPGINPIIGKHGEVLLK